MIGGDVLKVHRFFMPIFGMTAIMICLALWLIVRRFNHRTRQMALFLAATPLLAITYVVPKGYVSSYNKLEKALTWKMSFLASEMKKADSTDFSVALPTIGIFGHELMGHEIIDMLGLTDSTIARHSEESLPGMQTTWKEQKHNSRYLLETAPDYIVFSTGGKPSAPAERTLLLYEQFLRSYHRLAWDYRPKGSSHRTVVPAFKRVRRIEGEITPIYPIQYTQFYAEGLDYASCRNYKKAIESLNKAINVSEGVRNLSLLCDKASFHTMLGQHDIAMTLLNRILAEDSLVFQAHRELYVYALEMGDKAKASIHRRWLEKQVPWYLPRLDSLVAQQLR